MTTIKLIYIANERIGSHWERSCGDRYKVTESTVYYTAWTDANSIPYDSLGIIEQNIKTFESTETYEEDTPFEPYELLDLTIETCNNLNKLYESITFIPGDRVSCNIFIPSSHISSYYVNAKEKVKLISDNSYNIISEYKNIINCYIDEINESRINNIEKCLYHILDGVKNGIRSPNIRIFGLFELYNYPNTPNLPYRKLNNVEISYNSSQKKDDFDVGFPLGLALEVKNYALVKEFIINGAYKFGFKQSENITNALDCYDYLLSISDKIGLSTIVNYCLSLIKFEKLCELDNDSFRLLFSERYDFNPLKVLPWKNNPLIHNINSTEGKLNPHECFILYELNQFHKLNYDLDDYLKKILNHIFGKEEYKTIRELIYTSTVLCLEDKPNDEYDYLRVIFLEENPERINQEISDYQWSEIQNKLINSSLFILSQIKVKEYKERYIFEKETIWFEKQKIIDKIEKELGLFLNYNYKMRNNFSVISEWIIKEFHLTRV